MPKFIGKRLPRGHTQDAGLLEDNACPTDDLIRLSYSQASLMPDGTVYRSLDTTDRGSQGRIAKRWYRWFATARAVAENPRSTSIMLARATTRLGVKFGQVPPPAKD